MNVTSSLLRLTLAPQRGSLKAESQKGCWEMTEHRTRCRVQGGERLQPGPQGVLEVCWAHRSSCKKYGAPHDPGFLPDPPTMLSFRSPKS